MNTTEIIVGALAGILIIGALVLTALEKSVAQFLPILGIMVGYLVGAKQAAIAAIFSGKKKK